MNVSMLVICWLFNWFENVGIGYVDGMLLIMSVLLLFSVMLISDDVLVLSMFGLLVSGVSNGV